MRTNYFKTLVKAAVSATCILLFGAAAVFGQQQVNLTAGPGTTTLPDGNVVSMWGYSCEALAGAVTSGAATTSYTATTASDSALTMPPNAYVGATVTAGASTGIVLSNNGTTLTLTAAGWTGGTPTTGTFTLAAVTSAATCAPLSGAASPAAIGALGGVTVLHGGSGFTAAPTVNIIPAPGNTPSKAAVAVATIQNGQVTGITLTTAGMGYTAAPTVTFTNASTDTTGGGAVAASGLAWSPVLITVPYGTTGGLQINLTNNLSFTPPGATANTIPTSIVIVGQVGGGLGGTPTVTASPSHVDAQGCVSWFIADTTNTPPGTPCTTTTPLASPPTQGNRVQSMAKEVTAVAPGTPVTPTSLTWANLKPGTYLLESGTHPSIQVPMGLIGMLVVTTAPAAGTPGTAYPAVAVTPKTAAVPAVQYTAEVPLEFSEIDPVQNNTVNAAVNTANFSETRVWDGHTGACGNPSSGPGIYLTCYPPAVNYTPFYYLINGLAFSKATPSLSQFFATTGTVTATPTSGTILARLVNAGLRMHVPSIVGSQTTGFDGSGNSTMVSGFTLIAEDGNRVPGVPGVNGATPFAGAPRVQTDVFMAAGKVFDVMVNVPATPTGASAPSLPIYDRELSLSANSSVRDAGMLAYIGVSGSVLPASAGGPAGVFAAAKAVSDTYSSVVACASAATSCVPFVVADPSKGVIANDVNVYGVTLSSGPSSGTVTCGALPGNAVAGICGNGTFTYTPNPGFASDSFGYCANGAAPGTANLCTTVALNSSMALSGNPVANAVTFTAHTSTFLKIASPGVLAVDSDPSNLPLSVVGSSVPGTIGCINCSGLTVLMDPNGGFNASIATNTGTAAMPASATFTYIAQNSQGRQSSPATVTINFPTPSNLAVNVVDAAAYQAAGCTPATAVVSTTAGGGVTCTNAAGASTIVPAITDYRWIIEEDKTFWVDPNCTTNQSAKTPGCPGIVGPAGQSTIPTFGVNFHTSNMDYVAQGCTGALSCEGGQTAVCGTPGGIACPSGVTAGTHIPVACDLGNGACRPDLTRSGSTWVQPSSVHLDPTKRYYISVLPGDAGNPFPAYTAQPNCLATPYNPDGSLNTACGHTMAGAPVPPACNVLLSGCTAASTATFAPVAVLALPTPLPTGKLSVLVFEDDFPLNGEQDAGGGVDVLSAAEPGLGGFNLVLWDTYGSLGDVTGQDGFDMFNQPLSNSLAGTIDPVTGLDACPVSVNSRIGTIPGPVPDPANPGKFLPIPDPTQTGITGMIVTCPKYESDGQTLSPLAGQAVIANLMSDKFSVQAYPGADRIARGEEWIQTNTLDGQHPHDSFIRIGEPGYFQEYGPAGYHVSIGFANPKIINARHDAVCAGNYGPVGACTNIIDGQVNVQRQSRTPDQRLYPSGSRDALAWTQCWVSLGDPDAEDFMFTKCDANGNFSFKNVPGGNWRLTIGDQWNDQIIDGLSTPANVGCILTPPATTCPAGTITALHMGQIGVQQWQANLYTKTYVDDNKNGLPDSNEIGIPLIYTFIHYRDGSRANALTTDFNGIANFNETFPLFNWYVVETDTGRYKTTGIHTVYDAGGPADGTSYCGPANGARACGTSGGYNFLANTFEGVPLPADLSVPGAVYCAKADCSAEASSFAAGKAIPSSSTASTGRIDPPWVAAEGWSGETSQGNWMEFGKAPYAECPPACVVTGTGANATTTSWAENGGIIGEVAYAATRPFDSAEQMIKQPWEPNVPRVTVNLYQEGFAGDGVTPTLTMVDTTQTTSWDDWAQGFYPNYTDPATGTALPYLSCPGQGTATGTNADLFYFTLFDQPNYLDYYNGLHSNPQTLPHPLPYNSQYKCYDAMHIWNQIQPAPYDGKYGFPSSLGIDPTPGPNFGKLLTVKGSTNGVASSMNGTNCTICVANPTFPTVATAPSLDVYDPYRSGQPMLPPGKYVVEVIMPPGYEVYKEEDKNLLIGDNYIAPTTQQFSGLGGDIFIIPDQASVTSLYDPNANGYNPTNYQNATQNLDLQGAMLSGVPGFPGFQDPVWPCVGEMRVVPDYLSLFPQVKETAPFAGAIRPLCDRKEVTLTNQTSSNARFFIYTSTHIAAKFTGVITDDFTSEFDPFAPQFGEKFAPPNLPISTRDYLGNEVSRVYSDHFGLYDGLTFSSWDVNPPNITGYAPSMMVQCMNDAGPILDPAGSGKSVNDPLYNSAYSNFCYEEPYMPGLTTYLDTPVVPTQAFVGAGYNNADCAYPDTTPAIAEVDGDGVGPWVSAAGKQLTITALGNQMVNDYAYSGPSATAAPFNAKTVSRHYGFGTQGPGSSVVLLGSDGVKYPLTGVNWGDGTITGSVPSGLPDCTIQQQAQYGGPNGTTVSKAQCGELVITASNGKVSIDTVTVTVGGKAPKHVNAAATIQSAIDAAAPGDLIIVDPTCTTTGTTTATLCTTAGATTNSVATHSEMLIMWKPVRLQGVGAASTIINANTSPAGKLLDPWRRHINCLFGLTLQGAGMLPFSAGSPNPTPYDSTGINNCPDASWNYFGSDLTGTGSGMIVPESPQIDRLPSEGVLGWDATLNGNLAELLQEPSLMGAYEGAGITVLAKGVEMHGGNPWDSTLEGAFPTGSTLLTGVVSNPGAASSTAGLSGTSGPLGELLVGDANNFCHTVSYNADGTVTRTGDTNPYPSDFICNPSSIDGLSVTNSSQGGGGIFIHGWAHFLQVANNRVYNNAGTLSGGISVGQGEFGPPYLLGGGLANIDPGSCSDGTGFITNQHLPWCLDLHVNVHHNSITANSSIGDELFSATLSGGGGATVCTGNDYYKFNFNWVCGNLSAGEGGGLVHLGEIANGDISYNAFVLNQSSNPTIPTNGGGIMVQGTPDTDPTCPGVPDADCPSGLSDGTGHGLVINANLIQGNSADSGSGGGIRLQQVNGTEVGVFPGVYPITAASEAHTVTIHTTGALPSVTDSVTIAAVSVAGYNGTFTVTSVGTGFFTYLDTIGGLGTGRGGTFTDTTVAGTAQTITTATETGPGVVTITSTLSPTVNDSVTIAGLGGYNGTYAVTGVGAGTFTYNSNSRNLTAITGGTGTVVDHAANQSTASLWNSVSITNNIISNNMAGWDGAGISLNDALNVNIINNTIVHNDSLASSGVLTNSLGAPMASAVPAGSCTMVGPTGTDTASCPQSAGVTSTPNSTLLRQAMAGLTITCPAGHATCTGFSNPLLYNDIIWQNRSFYVGVGNSGTGALNQQNLVRLYIAGTSTPAPSQTFTGECSAGVTYWDIGVRGDSLTGRTPNHASTFTMSPMWSVMSGSYNGPGSRGNTNSDPNLASEFCNGSRVPPECTLADGCGGLNGFGVPPGINDAVTPNPVFSLVPSATVDEGNNWINVSWGPLSLSNPSITGGTYGNYGGGPALGNYALLTSSPLIDSLPCEGNVAPCIAPGEIIGAPLTDFYGNPRPDGNGGFDPGAVETTGGPNTAAGPTLTLISPDSGVRGTAVQVGLEGTNLIGATINPIAGVNISGVTVLSSTQISATFTISAGATPGARNVAVVTPVGTSNSVTFTVTAVSSVSPTSLTFNEPAGYTSASQTLRITAGDSGLTGVTITVTAPFARSAGGSCSTTAGFNLAALASCTFDVAYSPLSAEAPGTVDNGTVTISATAGGPVTGSPVALTGNVLAPIVMASVTPTSLAFGNWADGTTSNSMTARVTNTGNVPLSGGTFTFGGAGAAAFLRTGGGCTAGPLAVGAGCNLSIEFRPGTTVGDLAATLTVAYTGATVTGSTVTLTGTGVAMAVTPTSLTFAPRLVGTTSGQQTLTVHNATGSARNLTITVAGSFARQAGTPGTCGAALANGTSCTIRIVFSPTSTGPQAGSVTVTADGGFVVANSPVALTGTGQ